ncbi:MAG: aminoacyl-tRNA hydrolase [Candidatus Nealsonbacteria bacterium CG02_land_8_20_14_3_00_37_10]|uniref:Peptidyl-tRNA hydrolase n=2 Tax=Candidatus Nealsoniibacteriota TaxID=1817911 RepID=A0A2G9Z0A5_9BACT|nr:MAG: aminoacyl-tRNA hydrolase [Candidatus Nealsonbacteria bacterium CG23_combo_of_CG06-09_8_20_14_all_37_18]PIV45135.1 MAG: aminoacyl-tRNA hydrolase [Candidatus Nealsonbacteria bacterium CG02_land_8_20_14_3_00_37_10]
MILIVGLGNPGEKYIKTRHNIGSRVVDELCSSSYFATARVVDELKFSDKEGVILAKPKTFMNLSGKAVKSLLKTHALGPKNLIVIHDDIDIPLGEIKIVKNRGAAGHRGVQSIIKELSTKNFIRFRIGICPKAGKPKNIEKFVLQKPSEAKPSAAGDETKSQRPFNKEEEKIIREVIKKTAEAIEYFLKEGLEKAMNKFNK